MKAGDKRAGPPAPTIESPVRRRLIVAARAARRHAHARYSGFQVGAAVLDERGRIHVGCNVENASYGLTVCAERNAVAAAIVGGARRIVAVAVVAPASSASLASSNSNVTPPCGACRQVLAEFGGDGLLVLLSEPRGAHTERTLGALFPEPFRL
jgi:cytidine deaminase